MRNASTPRSFARSVRRAEWRVSYVPVPATTVARAPTASAAAAKSSSFSSSESVGLSPVVPATTIPSDPWSTRWLASSRNLSTLTEPSELNGVTIAVRTSPSIGEILLADAQTCFHAEVGSAAARGDDVGSPGGAGADRETPCEALARRDPGRDGAFSTEGATRKEPRDERDLVAGGAAFRDGAREHDDASRRCS